MCAVFVSLGWLSGAALLFVPLNGWVISLVFIVNAILYVCVARWARRKEKNEFPVSKNDLFFRTTFAAKIGALIHIGLVAYGLNLLARSQTNSIVLSPWQTITPQYIIIFFAATCIVGSLIFSRLKTRTIIVLLMLQTLLLTSYLPLTHQLIYGADGWRHIANEERFLAGKQFVEPVISNSADQKSVSQKIKTKVGQMSYSSFWSSSVIVAKIFKRDALTTTKWLLPILWSVLFPVLLFEIGGALGWGRKKSLLLAWLGLLPFAWQAAGSFSLPVGFGLLAWLFCILLLIKRIASPVKEQKLVLLLVGIGLVFGYALYVILFFLAWVVAELFIARSIQLAPGHNRILEATTQLRGLRLLAMVLGVVATIPVLELAAGYSQISTGINWLEQIKQVLGNFTGYYFVSGPRPHDIAFGNIIFNQMPGYAFVPNIFTNWPSWILIFMIGFYGLVINGLLYILKNKKITDLWFAVMGIGVTGSYVITNYFLSGSHIIARRLDGVAALFLVGLCCYGLYNCIARIRKIIFIQQSRWLQISIHMAGILIFAAAIAASYSLGPDTSTVSTNEYQAAQHIWSVEKNSSTKCVLADTYPLLALEAVSGKEIIGGNFPIDANFGQPERVRLFAQSTVFINNTLLEETGRLTGADHCWFVGSTDNFQKQGVLNGSESKVFGDTAVVRYTIINY